MTAWRDFSDAIDQYIRFPDGETDSGGEVTFAMVFHHNEEVEPMVPDFQASAFLTGSDIN